MGLAGAETCSRAALRWEIPPSRMVSATQQIYCVCVPLTAYLGVILFPFQQQNIERPAHKGYQYDLRQNDTSLVSL